MENIKENNRILGEFLGKKVITKEEFNPSIHTGEGLAGVYEIVDYTRYHREWNWLMPLVKKCDIIISENDLDEWTSDFYYALSTIEINIIYNTVIEFIKWYNKQNK